MKRVNQKILLPAADQKSELQRDPIDIEKLRDLYRTMVNESSVGFAVTDMQGRLLDFNACFREMVGYTDAELKSMTYRDLTPEKWHAKEEQILRERMLRRGQSPLFEKEYRRKDGTTFPVELNGFIVKSEQGEPTYTWALVRDITEKKRSEEKLRESEERYRTILDHIEEGYFEVDLKGNLSFFNEMVTNILGYEPAELAGMSYHAYFDDTNSAEMDEVCRVVCRGGNPVKDHDFVVKRKDGKKRNLAVSVSLKKDRNGKTAGFRGTVRDVTRRMKIQHALKVVEQRLVRLLENIDLGICWISPDYKLLFANKAIEEILEKNYVDLIEKNCFRLLGGREEVCPHCPGKIAMKERRRAEAECVGLRKDGTEFHLRLTAYPSYGPEGELTGFIEISEDITARKTQDMRIQESERKYRQLFEMLQEGIWVIDENAQTVIVNPRMAEMLGYTPEEMIGESLYHFTEESAKDAAKKYCQRRKNGVVEQYDFEFVRKDGTPINTSMAVAPIMDGKGSFQGAVAGVMDITKRKKAEDELRRSEERFSKAFINIPIPTVITDKKANRMIDGSDSWFRLTGYSREESVGRTLPELDLWVDTGLREVLLLKLSEEGSLCEETFQLRTKGGDIRDLLWSAEVFELNEEKVILSLLHDITERNRTAEAKKVLETQLQQAQRMEALGTLAGGIAHDFNNILGSMIGYAEMTLQRDLPEGGRGRYNLEQILKSGSRAKDLVNQILAFSRRQAPDKRPLHLIPVVNEALKLMRSSLPATIKIKQSIATENDYVLGDAVQYHQIMMNLCMNAAHAMKGAGGVLEISLDHKDLDEKTAERMALAPGPYLQVSVGDTGHGIPPEILPKIFEPFFSTKKNNEGTGLGLSVVYGIVKEFGGAVTVDSQPGKGARFDLYFPVLERPRRESRTRLSADPSLPKGTERILFVDDEPNLSSLGKEMLEHLGYRVTAVTSSSEALQIFKAKHGEIDLVITDYTMPVMTGTDLTKRILEIRPDMPVIMTTGYSEILTREKARAIGIRKMVMKPVFIRDLALTIRSILEN